MDTKLTTNTLSKLLQNTTNISEFIDTYSDKITTPPFSQYLGSLAKEKHFTIPELISKGSFNESYCYQLFKGIRNPSRNKILQLCFAMQLTLEESNKLLRIGEKNELYCKNKRDAIITFAINNKLSLLEVEEILIEKGVEQIINMD